MRETHTTEGDGRVGPRVLLATAVAITVDYLLGSGAIIAATAVQTWTWGGLALHADRLEPATARTVLDVVLFFGPVLTGACSR